MQPMNGAGHPVQGQTQPSAAIQHAADEILRLFWDPVHSGTRTGAESSSTVVKVAAAVQTDDAVDTPREIALKKELEKHKTQLSSVKEELAKLKEELEAQKDAVAALETENSMLKDSFPVHFSATGTPDKDVDMSDAPGHSDSHGELEQSYSDFTFGEFVEADEVPRQYESFLKEATPGWDTQAESTSVIASSSPTLVAERSMQSFIREASPIMSEVGTTQITLDSHSEGKDVSDDEEDSDIESDSDAEYFPYPENPIPVPISRLRKPTHVFRPAKVAPLRPIRIPASPLTPVEQNTWLNLDEESESEADSQGEDDISMEGP